MKFTKQILFSCLCIAYKIIKKICTADINFPFPWIYNDSSSQRMAFSLVSTVVEKAINLSLETTPLHKLRIHHIITTLHELKSMT